MINNIEAIKAKLLEARALIRRDDVLSQSKGTRNVWQRALVGRIDSALDHCQALIELSLDESNSDAVFERMSRYWPSGEVVVVTPEASKAIDDYFRGKTKEFLLS